MPTLSPSDIVIMDTCSETLDDGEVATIAIAVQRGGMAVLMKGKPSVCADSTFPVLSGDAPRNGSGSLGQGCARRSNVQCAAQPASRLCWWHSTQPRIVGRDWSVRRLI
jgi:hypothetical protein